MPGRRFLSLVLAACAGTAVLAGLALSARLHSAPQAPQDRALDLSLPTDRPLRITFFGTSLTHSEPWTDDLTAALAGCLEHPVEASVVARPGAAVDWALTQLDAVTTTAPDLVVMEFAINDADLRDGHSLRTAGQMHETLIGALQSALPEAQLMLMTMSPAQGLRGLARPHLDGHYQQYRDLATRQDVGLIDLYPRWRALPRVARGLARDGLHPDPEIATGVIVPAALKVLGGPGCA